MMSMMRGRRVTAIFVLAATMFTQACATYQRARGAIPAGKRVRVTTSSPIAVYDGPVATGAAMCQTTNVRGTVQKSSGDTLTLMKIKRLDAWGGASGCASFNSITILARPDIADVRVRHISIVRTTFLVLGLVLVAALATSHVEEENPCPECPGGY